MYVSLHARTQPALCKVGASGHVSQTQEHCTRLDFFSIWRRPCGIYRPHRRVGCKECYQGQAQGDHIAAGGLAEDCCSEGSKTIGTQLSLHVLCCC